ncbi:TlpA family protein disulfide reductase [Streptomyces sp. HUAS TT20]|uniref:TlpA family protein disulfide reductase n=1 Tax=Streptomyces sp. HUAS TT20 TaxID=3447509 RepID=UPI0021D89EBD|nr:TlpA disulfide reductase family protein [Streptomyces sp. HUAS 15-9]UXY30825.1 TlpA family protein disulfide reductase [Streptomyces sp. HUAS 15-9]
MTRSVRSIVPFAVAAVLAVGGAVVIASMDSSAPTGYHTSASGALTIDARNRPKAPDLTGVTIDGKPFDLAAWRGKTIVVNAWAFWCGPCRRETPLLVRYEKEMKDKGVVVVGLNQGSGTASAKAFVREFHVPYPNLHDPQGRAVLKIPKEVLRAQGVPFTVVIDSQYRIAATSAGEVNRSTLDEMTAWATKPDKSGKVSR